MILEKRTRKKKFKWVSFITKEISNFIFEAGRHYSINQNTILPHPTMSLRNTLNIRVGCFLFKFIFRKVISGRALSADKKSVCSTFGPNKTMVVYCLFEITAFLIMHNKGRYMLKWVIANINPLSWCIGFFTPLSVTTR